MWLVVHGRKGPSSPRPIAALDSACPPHSLWPFMADADAASVLSRLLQLVSSSTSSPSSGDSSASQRHLEALAFIPSAISSFITTLRHLWLFSNPATNNTTRLCVCELLEQLGPVLDQQHVLNCDEVLHEFLRPLDGEDCTAAVLSMRAIVSLAALAESRLDVYYRILRCFNSKRHSVCSEAERIAPIAALAAFAAVSSSNSEFARSWITFVTEQSKDLSSTTSVRLALIRSIRFDNEHVFNDAFALCIELVEQCSGLVLAREVFETMAVLGSYSEARRTRVLARFCEWLAPNQREMFGRFICRNIARFYSRTTIVSCCPDAPIVLQSLSSFLLHSASTQSSRFAALQAVTAVLRRVDTLSTIDAALIQLLSQTCSPLLESPNPYVSAFSTLAMIRLTRKSSSSRDWCGILHYCSLMLSRLYLLDLADEENIRRNPRKQLRVSLLCTTVEACRRLSQADESVRSAESVCKTLEQLLLSVCTLCLKRSRMLSDTAASDCPSLQQLCRCLARTLNFVRGVSVVTAVRDLFLHVDLRCHKVARALSAAFFRSMHIARKTAKATDALHKQIVTRSLSLSALCRYNVAVEALLHSNAVVAVPLFKSLLSSALDTPIYHWIAMLHSFTLSEIDVVVPPPLDASRMASRIYHVEAALQHLEALSSRARSFSFQRSFLQLRLRLYEELSSVVSTMYWMRDSRSSDSQAALAHDLRSLRSLTASFASLSTNLSLRRSSSRVLSASARKIASAASLEPASLSALPSLLRIPRGFLFSMPQQVSEFRIELQAGPGLLPIVSNTSSALRCLRLSRKASPDVACTKPDEGSGYVRVAVSATILASSEQRCVGADVLLSLSERGSNNVLQTQLLSASLCETRLKAETVLASPPPSKKVYCVSAAVALRFASESVVNSTSTATLVTDPDAMDSMLLFIVPQGSQAENAATETTTPAASIERTA